jgi:uncharacterized protein (DUF736 family)
MSNGKIKFSNDRTKLIGQSTAWTMNIGFWLELNRDRRSYKSPSHVVMAKAPAGHCVQVGVAWEYTIRTGNTSGLPMYSIQIDDPTLTPEPVVFSAFPNHHEEWAITVERKRQEQQVSQQGSDAASQDIPFETAAA